MSEIEKVLDIIINNAFIFLCHNNDANTYYISASGCEGDPTPITKEDYDLIKKVIPNIKDFKCDFDYNWGLFNKEDNESEQELSQNQIVHQVPQAPVIYPDPNEGNSEFEKFINKKENWELK